MAMGDGPNDSGLSRQHIISGCEASLRRLGTDHVDIYHVHEWDGQTRLEETLSALSTLVSAGKVRYLAVSNYAGWQLMKALALADDHGLERFAAQQIYYSLEARDAEYELVPLAVEQGLGILVWSPRAGGLLSGKYRRDASPSEQTRQLSGEWHEPPVRDQEKLYDTIDVLIHVAGAHGAKPAQVALAWLLGRPAVTSVVIGARTDEQLRDNLGAAEPSRCSGSTCPSHSRPVAPPAPRLRPDCECGVPGSERPIRATFCPVSHMSHYGSTDGRLWSLLTSGFGQKKLLHMG